MEPANPSLPADDVAAIDRLGTIYKELSAELSKVIIGQQRVVELLSIALFSRGHALLMGVPGLAKTLLISSVAKTLDLSFNRIQFTPDLMPADITGTDIIQDDSAGGKRQFEFIRGPVFANIVLADEINRAPAKTQSALLEAMEELHVTVDGKTYELPQPFVVLATQNPVGSAGTQMLPPSQMDRFMIKISMGYPDFESQISILRDRHTENPLNRVTPVVDREQLQALIQEAAKAEIQDAVYEYVTRLTQASREHPMVQLGVSPRGALAVCRMAKAYAYLNGRDFVIPEDVAAVFPDVCCHRLVLTTKARMMEERPETVIAAILDSVKMPVIKQ